MTRMFLVNMDFFFRESQTVMIASSASRALEKKIITLLQKRANGRQRDPHGRTYVFKSQT